jgi:class 3 adenylate cyclase
MTARRLAAILAADIVGYSRLMGEDEADTVRAVRERREAAQPIVANPGPHRETTGDGAAGFLDCRGGQTAIAIRATTRRST